MADTVQEMFSSFYGPNNPYNQKGGLFGGGALSLEKDRYKETSKDIQDLLNRIAQGGEAPTVGESFGAAAGTSFSEGFGRGLMGDPEMEKAKQRDQLAKEYQEATKDMAPNDPNRYILQAQILGQLGDFEGQTKSLTLANTLLEEASEYADTSSKEDRDLTSAYLEASGFGDLDATNMRLATQEISDEALLLYNKQKQNIKAGRLDPKKAEPLKSFILSSINTAIDEKKLSKKDGWFSDSVEYTFVKPKKEDNADLVTESGFNSKGAPQGTANRGRVKNDPKIKARREALAAERKAEAEADRALMLANKPKNSGRNRR